MNPPAFVIWDEYIGASLVYYTNEGAPKGKEEYAYWVYWHQIQVLP